MALQYDDTSGTPLLLELGRTREGEVGRPGDAAAWGGLMASPPTPEWPGWVRQPRWSIPGRHPPSAGRTSRERTSIVSRIAGYVVSDTSSATWLTPRAA
jgi:hypothetical protein